MNWILHRQLIDSRWVVNIPSVCWRLLRGRQLEAGHGMWALVSVRHVVAVLDFPFLLTGWVSQQPRREHTWEGVCRVHGKISETVGRAFLFHLFFCLTLLFFFSSFETYKSESRIPLRVYIKQVEWVVNEKLWVNRSEPLKYLHTDGALRSAFWCNTICPPSTHFYSLRRERHKTRASPLLGGWNALVSSFQHLPHARGGEKQFWLLAPFSSTLPGAVRSDRIGRLAFRAITKQEVQTCQSHGGGGGSSRAAFAHFPFAQMLLG